MYYMSCGPYSYVMIQLKDFFKTIFLSLKKIIYRVKKSCCSRQLVIYLDNPLPLPAGIIPRGTCFRMSCQSGRANMPLRTS